MKDKIYIAINLNDFHNNQNGKSETTTQLLFISAKSLEAAKKSLQKIIWKYCMERNS